MAANNDVQTVKVGDILPNENVLQVFPIDVHTLGTVEESIKENGILSPIMIGTDRVIIDGHTRHTAAVNLGLKTVPVRVLDMEGNSEKGVDFAIHWQMGRRNLTTKQKMEKVALALQLHPKWTDRRIARQYGVSPTSVGNVRKALKDGGKITAALEGDEEVRETASGKTQKVGSRNKATTEKAARLPSALLTDPALTVAQVSAMEFDIDELNAINRWYDLLGQYLRTKPKAVSKEQRKAEAEKAKAEAKAKAAAEKAEAKARELEEKAKALREGKTPPKAAKKAAAKVPAKKTAAKKAGKGRK